MVKRSGVFQEAGEESERVSGLEQNHLLEEDPGKKEQEQKQEE